VRREAGYGGSRLWSAKGKVGVEEAKKEVGREGRSENWSTFELETQRGRGKNRLGVGGAA